MIISMARKRSKGLLRNTQATNRNNITSEEIDVITPLPRAILPTRPFPTHRSENAARSDPNLTETPLSRGLPANLRPSDRNVTSSPQPLSPSTSKERRRGTRSHIHEDTSDCEDYFPESSEDGDEPNTVSPQPRRLQASTRLAHSSNNSQPSIPTSPYQKTNTTTSSGQSPPAALCPVRPSGLSANPRHDRRDISRPGHSDENWPLTVEPLPTRNLTSLDQLLFSLPAHSPLPCANSPSLDFNPNNRLPPLDPLTRPSPGASLAPGQSPSLRPPPPLATRLVLDTRPSQRQLVQPPLASPPSQRSEVYIIPPATEQTTQIEQTPQFMSTESPRRSNRSLCPTPSHVDLTNRSVQEKVVEREPAAIEQMKMEPQSGNVLLGRLRKRSNGCIPCC